MLSALQVLRKICAAPELVYRAACDACLSTEEDDESVYTGIRDIVESATTSTPHLSFGDDAELKFAPETSAKFILLRRLMSHVHGLNQKIVLVSHFTSVNHYVYKQLLI